MGKGMCLTALAMLECLHPHAPVGLSSCPGNIWRRIFEVVGGEQLHGIDNVEHQQTAEYREDDFDRFAQDAATSMATSLGGAVATGSRPGVVPLHRHTSVDIESIVAAIDLCLGCG